MEPWKKERMHELITWSNGVVRSKTDPDWVVKKLVAHRSVLDRLRKIRRALKKERVARKERFFGGNSVMEDYSGR